MVSVKEDFRAYVAPPWVAPTVVRLLQSVPPARLVGLSTIVLTESATTSKVKMHRQGGRKYGPKARLGFYRPAWNGRRPTIYLIVDNILAREDAAWLQMKRDVIMADVLFHEIGHHLNANVGLIARNEEASAIFVSESARAACEATELTDSSTSPNQGSLRASQPYHRSGGCSL